MLSRLKVYTKKFWQAKSKYTSSFFPVVTPESALLDTVTAGGRAESPLFWAKKKKRKPASTPARPSAKSPSRKKARHKPLSPEPRTVKKASFSQKADKYFDGWSNRISAEALSRADWGRMAILAAGMLVILFYGFSSGGYFPIRRSYGELWVLYLVIIGLLFNWQVPGRMSRIGIAETGVIGAYAFWILLSVTWSYIPSESYSEFLRAILYLAGFGLFYMYLARREWLAWIGHMFVMIVAAVMLASIFGKIFPDQKPYEFDARLTNPITYWNTMALFAVMAFPIGLRVLADKKTSLVTRCLYASALFLFLIVMYFTFSRASYPLFLIIMTVYILASVHRLRAIMQAGLSLFWTAVTIGVCYLWLPGMLKLAPSLDERVDQGHKLGIVLLLMFIFVVASQIALRFLEKRITFTADQARTIGRGLAVTGAVAVVLAGGFYLARYGNPVSKITAQTGSSEAKRTQAAETAGERLFSLQSERFQEYRVSIGIFKEKPLTGTGAATWQVSWQQDRPEFLDEAGKVYDMPVKNGHSIFFDALAELGIAGAGLLVSIFVLFIVMAVKDMRFLGRSWHREIYGAFFAASLALAIHAQFDWDWQMPVVFLPFFMFAGLLLRYGMLSRAQAEDERTREAGVQDKEEVAGLGRSYIWRWALGAACLVAMLLVIFFLLSETRLRNANEQAVNVNTLAQQGNMTLGGKYIELEKTARSARSYDIFKLDTESLILQAMAAQGQGKTDDAEALLLEAREIEPNNYRIYLNLSRLYGSKQDVERAKENIRMAKKLNPLESKEIGVQEMQVRAMGAELDYFYGPGGVLLAGKE